MLNRSSALAIGVVAPIIVLTAAAAFSFKRHGSGGGTSVAGGSSSVGDEEFVGPFPNWINALTGKRVDGTGSTLCTGAAGNGTDDSAKLQNCLNQLGATTPVLWLPAPPVRYGIQSTLSVANQQYVSVIGEDPATTVIRWDGAAGGRMALLDGITYSSVNRLTFDGNNLAGVLIDQAYTITFDTGNQYTDDVFKNTVAGADFTGVGFRCGNGGQGCAETTMLRNQFINNPAAGAAMRNFNALDLWVWYSTFTNNGTGLTNYLPAATGVGAGSYQAYQNNFFGSTIADMRFGNTELFNAGYNYSSGSNRFFGTANGIGAPNPLIIFGNTIVNSTQSLAVENNTFGPTIFVNNILKSLPGATPPFAATTSHPTLSSMFSMNNTFTAGTAACGSNVDAHVCHSTNDVVNASASIPSAPTLPGTPQTVPGRIIKEAVASGGTGTACSAAIPCTLTNAIAQAIAAGSRSVVHVQAGTYNISSTVTVPASDIQIIGDGGSSELVWTGGANGQIMQLTGPSKVIVAELMFKCNGTSNGILVTNADQPGSQVYLEQPVLSHSQVGLFADSLDYTLVEPHNMSNLYATTVGDIGTKVVGGSDAQLGTWRGGSVNIFAGLNAQNDTDLQVSNGGHVYVNGIWHDTGAGGGKRVLSLSGQYGAMSYTGTFVAFSDSSFSGTASIGGAGNTTMTVTGVNPGVTGPLIVGSLIYGPTIAPNTFITVAAAGGGIGTYTITPAQAVASSTINASNPIVEFDINGWHGTTNIMGMLMDGKISFRGSGSGANNLSMGLAQRSATFWANTTSPADTYWMLNGQAFTQGSSCDFGCTESPELPNGSPTIGFLNTTMDQFIKTAPTIPAPTPAGVTDVRMRRIFVDNARVSGGNGSGIRIQH